jgi:CMP-N-acetylneuraminic acid synthetase
VLGFRRQRIDHRIDHGPQGLKIAIQVPIKAQSERLAGKNFRYLGGKPLFAWMLDELLLLRHEADIWTSTEARLASWAGPRPCSQAEDKIADYYNGMPFKVAIHHPRLAGKTVNGNHLLHAFAFAHPDYDLYLQAFVTAPTLTAGVMFDALNTWTDAEADSFFLATEEKGFIWYHGKPVNQTFVPDGLPRTQDAAWLKETTGLYGILREPLLETGCRIGRRPLPVIVDQCYAYDIDTQADWNAVEAYLKSRESVLA